MFELEKRKDNLPNIKTQTLQRESDEINKGKDFLQRMEDLEKKTKEVSTQIKNEKKKKVIKEKLDYSKIYECTNGDILIVIAFLLDSFLIDGICLTLGDRKVRIHSDFSGVEVFDEKTKKKLFEIDKDLSPRYFDSWCDEVNDITEISEIIRKYK